VTGVTGQTVDVRSLTGSVFTASQSVFIAGSDQGMAVSAAIVETILAVGLISAQNGAKPSGVTTTEFITKRRDLVAHIANLGTLSYATGGLASTASFLGATTSDSYFGKEVKVTIDHLSPLSFTWTLDGATQSSLQPVSANADLDLASPVSPTVDPLEATVFASQTPATSLANDGNSSTFWNGIFAANYLKFDYSTVLTDPFVYITLPDTSADAALPIATSIGLLKVFITGNIQYLDLLVTADPPVLPCLTFNLDSGTYSAGDVLSGVCEWTEAASGPTHIVLVASKRVFIADFRASVSSGVKITFSSTSGYTIGDRWTTTVGTFCLNPLASTYPATRELSADLQGQAMISGASFYFTVDGTEPTVGSDEGSSASSLLRTFKGNGLEYPTTAANTYTIKVLAVLAGYPSVLVTRQIKIKLGE
jgi:hypothetical protein